MIATILDEIYKQKEVMAPDGTRRAAFPASLPLQDGQALYEAVLGTNSTQTLEIGMAYGASTLFMLKAVTENGGGAHVAIDPYQDKWWEGIGRSNVMRAECADMVRLLEQPSHLALPRLLSENARFDFIFIDGNHRFEFTLVDFFFADRLLKVGGHIMLHDAWLPSIRKVLSFICRDMGEQYTVSADYNGNKQAGVSFWHCFLKTLHTAPFDLLSAYFFSQRDFNRHCILEKVAECDDERRDADWTYYRPF